MTSDPNTPETEPPAELRALIQRDYMAGDSAAVVAERYGVSERTVRRHAAEQGWRRCDSVAGAIDPAWPEPVRRGVYSPRRTMEQVLEQWPQLEGVARVNTADLDDLLLQPDPETLRHFAFKRAAEAAAMARPSEALSWMRLVGAVDRSGDRIEREERRFSRADRFRAAFFGAIERRCEEAEENDAALAAAPEAD